MVGGGDLGGRGFGRAEDALLELRELDYTPSGSLLGGCWQVAAYPYSDRTSINTILQTPKPR
jgi:hypothetical protein